MQPDEEKSQFHLGEGNQAQDDKSLEVRRFDKSETGKDLEEVSPTFMDQLSPEDPNCCGGNSTNYSRLQQKQGSSNDVLMTCTSGIIVNNSSSSLV